MATAGAPPAGGIMGMMGRPEFWNWMSGVGAGLSRAGAGQGYDISGANQQLFQSMADRKAQQRLGGLMDQFGLTPQQRSIMGELPVDAQRKVLTQQAFPSPEKLSDWERAVSMLPPEERLQAARIVTKILAGEGAGADNYGLTPVYGTDAEGKPAILQLGKSGQPNQVPLPEGFNIARDPIRMDAGTHWVLIDPQTRQPIGTVPKELREAAAETAGGGVEGKKAAEKTIKNREYAIQAEQNLAVIDNLLNDPYLDSMTGPVRGRMPNLSSDAARVQSKLMQVTGAAFMEAYDALKGGGSITDREGAAATAAKTRLGGEGAVLMDPKDYREAIMELRIVMQNGLRRARGEEVPEYISPHLPEEGAESPFAGVEHDFTAEQRRDIQAAAPGTKVKVDGVVLFEWDGKRLLPAGQ